jgi:predicted Zn finger-like uncharacterized protein
MSATEPTTTTTRILAECADRHIHCPRCRAQATVMHPAQSRPGNRLVRCVQCEGGHFPADLVVTPYVAPPAAGIGGVGYADISGHPTRRSPYPPEIQERIGIPRSPTYGRGFTTPTPRKAE